MRLGFSPPECRHEHRGVAPIWARRVWLQELGCVVATPPQQDALQGGPWGKGHGIGAEQGCVRVGAFCSLRAGRGNTRRLWRPVSLPPQQCTDCLWPCLCVCVRLRTLTRTGTEETVVMCARQSPGKRFSNRGRGKAARCRPNASHGPPCLCLEPHIETHTTRAGLELAGRHADYRRGGDTCGECR